MIGGKEGVAVGENHDIADDYHGASVEARRKRNKWFMKVLQRPESMQSVERMVQLRSRSCMDKDCQ